MNFPVEVLGEKPKYNRAILYENPVDASGWGRAGGRRRGGATKGGSCGTAEPHELRALVPIFKGVWGLTIESHPTFWFYIPYKTGEFHSAKFVLWDKDRTYRYEKNIPSSQPFPNLISISIPQTKEPLEIGKEYNVVLKVYCEDPEEASDPTDVVKVDVRNFVVRISADEIPGLQSELDQAGDDLRQQAVIYAKYGIWFDALRIIGELRQQEPNNPQYQEDWNKLLEDIDMKISK
ncbi:DUF928 domain-containing protein [Okeania sp. SIO2B3]|uniref:DUF928 domain-containing protein n=1 Tax=Okeania sp. SIO2B3 TaxID=2607784 RepID=UPI0013BFA5DA|nr:DUF928 domain-containing protein [Okeania sp. SIO2B3]NET45931.1 DUF928 domain-containing protein [Okeania sp. SIO2B3]